MKKNICLVVAITLFFSCNEQKKHPENSYSEVQTSPASESAKIDNPDFPLLAKYDCKTCHMSDEKLAGPSYKEIAVKYTGVDTAIKYLAGKIITGGSGVWGQVPMTPHPGMPQDDAEQLAAYIMSLK